MKALARLLARLAPCPHDGSLAPLRTLPHGVEIWRCERCRSEVLVAGERVPRS